MYKGEILKKKEAVLIILGIVFISFNLRAPITAVGPLIGMIKTDYLLASGMAGLITTLPLLAFGLVSPFVAGLSNRWGYGKVMGLGLVLIFIGGLVRSYTTLWGLFMGTALLGIGIALGNVLIPSIIKLKFPHRLGLATSLYTASMLIFAAIGAGVSIPLAKGLDLGWRHALAVWSILALVTFLIWLPQLKVSGTTDLKALKPTEPGGQQAPSPSIWTSPLAWSVTFFMGIQSFIFYSLVAWLPSIIIAKGMTDSFAGTMALTYQLVGIPAALMMPILCDQFKNQRGLVLLTCFFYLSGISLLLFSQGQGLIVIAVLLMALGMGASISLALTFISLRSPNAQRASELSGMSQSTGYLLAAIGPILMGLIYDSFKSWSWPLIIFALLIIVLGLVGWFAGDDRSTPQ